MNEDIENRLARVTPRGAPPELRGRVLNAVAGELARLSDALATTDHTPPNPPFARGGKETARDPLSPPLAKGAPTREAWGARGCLGSHPRGYATGAETALSTNTRARPTLFLGLVASAAAVLAGLALNVWVNAELDRRLASVLGPPPVSGQVAEIAAEIAHVTNPAVGQWAYQRLADVPRRGDEAYHYASRLQQMIQQLTLDLGETVDEAPQEDSRMDRDRHDSRDRRPAAAQRLLRLEHRNTA